MKSVFEISGCLSGLAVNLHKRAIKSLCGDKPCNLCIIEKQSDIIIAVSSNILLLSLQASFFIAYVVTLGWTSTLSELFCVVQFIQSLLQKCCCRCCRNRSKTDEFEFSDMAYHREIPRILFFGLLGITYFFLAPLILPFLLIYFFLAYIIFKNQVSFNDLCFHLFEILDSALTFEDCSFNAEWLPVLICSLYIAIAFEVLWASDVIIIPLMFIYSEQIDVQCLEGYVVLSQVNILCILHILELSRGWNASLLVYAFGWAPIAWWKESGQAQFILDFPMLCSCASN